MSERISKVMVSSDVAGVAGPENIIDRVYDGILPNAGVEVICWWHRMKDIAKWKGKNHMIGGFHGQIHLRRYIGRNMMATAMDTLIVGGEGIGTIMSKYPGAYFLVHEECAVGDWVDEFRRNNWLLLLENIKRPGSLVNTEETIKRLRGSGGKFDLMMDLYHLSCEMDVPGRLDKVLGEVESVLNRWKGEVRVHLPIGTREADSFNIRNTDRETLKTLGRMLGGKKVVAVVLENQQEGLGMVWPRVGMIRENTQETVGRLKDSGVI